MTQILPTILPDGTQVASMGPRTAGIPQGIETAQGSKVVARNPLHSLQQTGPPQPVRDLVVSLVNTSDRLLKQRYLTVDYIIQPHDSMIVPYDVMVCFMGMPDAQDLSPRAKHRSREVQRLRVRYGAYFDDDLWEVSKPPIEAYRVNGERIITPLDDPLGLTIPQGTMAAHTQGMAAQIEQLQQQIASLQLHAQQTGVALPTPPAPVGMPDVPPGTIPMPEQFASEGAGDMAGGGVVPPGSTPQPVPPGFDDGESITMTPIQEDRPATGSVGVSDPGTPRHVIAPIPGVNQ